MDRTSKDLPHPEELEALYWIVTCTADATGERFFDELVRCMAETLEVRISFVSVFTPDATKMRLLAWWDAEGDAVLRGLVYDVRPTPCSRVVEGQLFHCARDVQRHFPNDPHLRALGAESYRGVPLIGPSGRHIGHLAAVDSKPMEEEARFIITMQIFATRATAELERLHAEKAVLDSERRLKAVLQSALDAIVMFEADGKIALFNEAAERAFGSPAAEALGEHVDRFLSPALAERVWNFIDQGLKDSPHGGFLTQSEVLTARRANGSSFPIEATISRVSLDECDCYTLILRDISERLTARKQISRLRRDRELLQEALRRTHDCEPIVGESPALKEVLQNLELVAGTETTVLILGETGTGKELVARTIHFHSERREGPMVTVNCTALPSELIESELFGHEKGSFTGATEKRIGRFELADGGTIFLDEIGDLPLGLQAKLLRVLQEREFEPVGSSTPREVDVRVIAATNRDLEGLVAEGRFREDLYYRLNVFPLQIPPLRERREDIPLLAEFFIRRQAARLGCNAPRLSDEAVRKMLAYDWPGNVRELANVIERALVLCREGPIDPCHVGILADPGPPEEAGFATLQEMERRHILTALRQTEGKVSGPGGAADLLGLKPTTLDSRMKRLGISRKDALPNGMP